MLMDTVKALCPRPQDQKGAQRMKALKCCKINFLQIRTNWKYWICLAFVVLQMWSITGDMGAYAQALHYPHVAPWLHGLQDSGSRGERR